MEEPTATPIARSILFFIATNTAASAGARLLRKQHVLSMDWRQLLFKAIKQTLITLCAPVMCSQALPAMGSTMRPRKDGLMLSVSLTASMAPVRYLRGVAMVDHI